MNARRLAAVEVLINDAVERGGQLLSGGRRIGNKDNFMEPTVLADVPTDARIMTEEPFGPVIIVNRFDSYDAAITEANRLPYGLAAYAFTTSAKTQAALARDVETGMLTINHLGLGLPETPFGGMKESGYGTEGGADALSSYLVAKYVTQAAG